MRETIPEHERWTCQRCDKAEAIRHPDRSTWIEYQARNPAGGKVALIHLCPACDSDFDRFVEVGPR